MRAWLAGQLERIWYGRSALIFPLIPLSWIYAALLERHRRRAAADRTPLHVPIVVVGNVTVGGTGKTPIVIWLVRQLLDSGYHPGIVTRGYGGNTSAPLVVTADTSTREAGDEAVLLARRLRCPVVACRDRVRAVQTLLKTADVDVVISDDGLQHFALKGNCEIVIVDGSRGTGNGRLLPAGPLREPAARIADADIVMVNGPGWMRANAVRFDLKCTSVVRLCDGEQRALADFAGRDVRAHAAIGHPQRFFEMLRTADCRVDEHAWPDHAAIPIDELAVSGNPVLITEKDAVKLMPPVPADVWSVNVDVDLSENVAASVLESVRERIRHHATSQ